MTSVTYPTVSNHSAKYTYGFDASARPSTMQDINSVTQVSGLSYGPSNELLGITYYGLSETRTYNSRLQLTAITAPAFSVQYVYPATTNIGKVGTQYDLVTGEQVTYQYDSLQRLISAQTTAASDNQYPNLKWGQGSVYDGFGNLTQKTAIRGSVPTLSVTVDQTTNRVAGTYDQNGNLTGDGTNLYTFDIENRMVAMNGGTFYAYDPQNRRVLKQTSSGAQEVYFYGPDGKKLGTYLPTFTGTPYFYASDISVYFGNRRVSHGALQGSTLVFTNTLLDRLNSVRNAGSSGTASSFYPYGEDKGTAAPNDQMKFGTYTRDSASGLDYAMNRYYSNTWGRFTTPDPYSGSAHRDTPQSWNRYAYLLGDPLGATDPLGLCDPGESDCEEGAGTLEDTGPEGNPGGDYTQYDNSDVSGTECEDAAGNRTTCGQGSVLTAIGPQNPPNQSTGPTISGYDFTINSWGLSFSGVLGGGIGPNDGYGGGILGAGLGYFHCGQTAGIGGFATRGAFSTPTGALGNAPANYRPAKRELKRSETSTPHAHYALDCSSAPLCNNSS